MDEQYFADQIAECQLSAIYAKAYVRLANGRYRIVVVYGMSTQKEFYWIYEAPSPRSPKSAWTRLGAKDRSGGNYYKNLRSFAIHYAALTRGQFTSIRYTHKEFYKAVLIDPSLRFSLQAKPEDPRSIKRHDYLDRKYRAARAGGIFNFKK